ncbi:MAG: histidine phosphatase family protein [Candidatus Shapirobacteria bacterium]
MAKIYFVRHGEVDNPEKLIYGRLPGFGLTKLGEKQAQQAAEYLLSLKAKPEIIITSPLLRTKSTAEIIVQFFPKIKLVEEKAIIEGNLDWEGKREADLIKKGIWDVYLNFPSKIKTGETFLGIQQRAVSWLKNCLEKKDYQEYVVVSHKDVIRGLTVFLEGRLLDDLVKVPCDFASITTVVFGKELRLLEPVSYWEPATS